MEAEKGDNQLKTSNSQVMAPKALTEQVSDEIQSPNDAAKFNVNVSDSSITESALNHLGQTNLSEKLLKQRNDQLLANGGDDGAKDNTAGDDKQEDHKDGSDEEKKELIKADKDEESKDASLQTDKKKAESEKHSLLDS